MMGMTGDHNGTGFDNIEYMVCRPENDFFPDLTTVSRALRVCQRVMLHQLVAATLRPQDKVRVWGRGIHLSGAVQHSMAPLVLEVLVAFGVGRGRRGREGRMGRARCWESLKRNGAEETRTWRQQSVRSCTRAGFGVSAWKQGRWGVGLRAGAGALAQEASRRTVTCGGGRCPVGADIHSGPDGRLRAREHGKQVPRTLRDLACAMHSSGFPTRGVGGVW